MKPRLDTIAYGGWSRCLRLTDGRTELIATTEVGPRLIRYGFPGGPNLLKEFPRQMGTSGGTLWKIFGGHRLWHAPEAKPETYTRDHGPIAWKWDGRTLRLIQPMDPPTGLIKQISVSFAEHGGLRLVHRLTNGGRTAQELAPWTLTVMAPGGRALIPQEPPALDRGHLLPARPLVLWRYTDMSDPRWSWGRHFVQLQQDDRVPGPQKVGWLGTRGWMAYATPHALFIKRHPFQAGATYPDFNCNGEAYTNRGMLELESLGPLTRLAPGRHVEHVETWNLFPVRVADFGEKALLKQLPPLVRKTPRPAR